ncbi:MAG: RnfABCDGE type electron transport complex subunit G [Deltaproteobacteria bacterium]|nr:RnfABCDGE type electron transport complex subunit G [Deltaproteobacteria bacterium]
MREMIKMVVVLAILSSVSGGLLAAVRNGTKDRIENQQLQMVKGPAIRAILEGCTNDPVADRFKLSDDTTERSFFIGVFNGKPEVIAFEAFGKGYGGDIGLMVAVNLADDKLVGVGVTTHSETPGLGAKAKTDPAFAKQFKGASALAPVKVTNDGGVINSLSGATITSRSVCAAATEAGQIYQRLKPQISDKLKSLP